MPDGTVPLLAAPERLFAFHLVLDFPAPGAYGFFPDVFSRIFARSGASLLVPPLWLALRGGVSALDALALGPLPLDVLPCVGVLLPHAAQLLGPFGLLHAIDVPLRQLLVRVLAQAAAQPAAVSGALPCQRHVEPFPAG